MAKLDISVLIGAESKQFLADLDAVVTRLERVAGMVGAQAEEAVVEPKPVKKVAAKKPTTAVEEETFDLGGEAEQEADKQPDVTIKEVIAACKSNREVAIKALKRMKVNSVHELKPAQYSGFLNEIGA